MKKKHLLRMNISIILCLAAFICCASAFENRTEHHSLTELHYQERNQITAAEPSDPEEEDPTSGYDNYDPWMGWDAAAEKVNPWIYVLGTVMLAGILAAIVITLCKRKYKTEKNVRVAAVIERLSGIPTPISRAGSAGPGTAMMENITVTFVRADNTSFSLLCSAEDAHALTEGVTGDVTYRGQELISFVRSGK